MYCRKRQGLLGEYEIMVVAKLVLVEESTDVIYDTLILDA
jgi:hypothetical protein